VAKEVQEKNYVHLARIIAEMVDKGILNKIATKPQYY
jgi:hypothetical protein